MCLTHSFPVKDIEADIGKTLNTEEMVGYVGILSINEVPEPQIWKYNGEDLFVCDNNYQWLTIMPKNDYYCLTVMMNENREMQVCYIDMDELQEALQKSDITQQQYEQALLTSEKLKKVC